MGERRRQPEEFPDKICIIFQKLASRVASNFRKEEEEEERTDKIGASFRKGERILASWERLR